MKNPLERLKKLYEQTEQQWQKQDYRMDSFVHIAQQQLTHVDTIDIDGLELMRYLLDTAALPQQMYPRHNFASPSVTLFGNERFCVDLYFWRAGSTAIHDHHFCGAFQLLQGKSHQTSFLYQPHHALTEYMSQGELKIKKNRTLVPGEIQSIHGGQDFIHTVSHLADVTISLCVRTNNFSDLLLNRYYYPGLKLTVTNLPQTAQKKLLLLQTLWSQEQICSQQAETTWRKSA